jgi:uroporphyrinogen decarboxylase
MTDKQWNDLLRIIGGELLEPLPVGFIIDSPWLPGWAGMPILDYYADNGLWLEANLKAVERYPGVMFLPGFWAEYGMCTEPSAFGAKCVFPEHEFPFAEKVLDDYDRIAGLKLPDCRTDGLCPFVIKRLVNCRGEIEDAEHKIRFAVSRGPHNIASFLMGHTELLIGVKTNPDEVRRLFDLVTDFVVQWLQYQAAAFDTVDGILVLDDLIGFLGEDDFVEFALPCFKRIAASLDVSVKALHNDARGLITARHLPEMGFNLFNFAFEHPLGEIRRLAGDSVTLLGNMPPRDVLASGTPDDVKRAASEILASVDDRRRIIFSCGGGMPPGVSSENLEAFVAAVAGG